MNASGNDRFDEGKQTLSSVGFFVWLSGQIAIG
jgi:hypothetical protein